MMKTLTFSVAAAVLAFFCCAPAAFGQERELANDTDGEDVVGGELAELAIPAELQDPAFDKYVSLEFLRDAWTSLDAAALADAGLQLAEGERVLFRSHEAASADEVLRVAVQVAAKKHDQETLERLKRAADGLGRSELAATIATSQKLAAEPRTTRAPVSVPLDELSPEILQDYRVVMQIIENLRIRGDKPMLESFAKTLNEDEHWPPKSLANLNQILRDAKSDLSGVVASESLQKLSGPSRTAWQTVMVYNKLSYTNAPSGVWVQGDRRVPSSIGGATFEKFGPYKIYRNQRRTFYTLGFIKLSVKQTSGLVPPPQYLNEGIYDIVMNVLGTRYCRQRP